MPSCSDGARPFAGLIAYSSGNLYGTTENGGAAGNGVVFKLSPDGTETVLHSFTGRTWRVVPHAHAANWPGFAPPDWPVFLRH